MKLSNWVAVIITLACAFNIWLYWDTAAALGWVWALAGWASHMFTSPKTENA